MHRRACRVFISCKYKHSVDLAGVWVIDPKCVSVHSSILLQSMPRCKSGRHREEPAVDWKRWKVFWSQLAADAILEAAYTKHDIRAAVIVVCSIDGCGLPQLIVNHVVLIAVKGIETAVPAIEVIALLAIATWFSALFIFCHELTIADARRECKLESFLYYLAIRALNCNYSSVVVAGRQLSCTYELHIKDLRELTVNQELGFLSRFCRQRSNSRPHRK